MNELLKKAADNGFNIAQDKTPNIEAFSINVQNGIDTQIIYSLNNGDVFCVYDWYNENKTPNQIIATTLKLQLLFGFPVNVRYSFENEKVHITSISPIYQINFTTTKEQFTNANFRDGGVSARPCNALLASLYYYSYHNTLKNFFVRTKAFKAKNITPQIHKFGGKLYWNVSSCKTACLKLLGFVERDYDKDLGIYPNYEGKGKTSKITPLFLLRLPFIASAVYKTLKNNERDLEKNKTELLEKYHCYNNINLTSLSLPQKQTLFKELILDYYNKNEGVYFWQVFVNIIRLSLYRRKIKKAAVSNDEYLNLLSEIKDISHTRIIKTASKYAMLTKENPNALDGLASKLNQEFGYHSHRELDLTYPNYHEDIMYAKELINSVGDNCDSDDENTGFEKQYKLLSKKLKKATTSIRKFLWWREEFKDLSTRCYSVIRKFALSLASDYVKNRIIEHKDDIFHLDFNDIFHFIDGKLSADELRFVIQKNKQYYESFVNFVNPNEIGGDICVRTKNTASNNESQGYDQQTAPVQTAEIFGAGCGGGVVKGIARVIENLADLENAQAGEILIAKHFDAGFISKFSIIAGIITETGGVLCHSAIIAREYNLPAIVSASGALKQIKTGDKIEMDAQTGKITR